MDGNVSLLAGVSGCARSLWHEHDSAPLTRCVFSLTLYRLNRNNMDLEVPAAMAARQSRHRCRAATAGGWNSSAPSQPSGRRDGGGGGGEGVR
jgi:hypothetical protein